MSTDLTERENTILGSSAAFIIGVTLQPTVYSKNARQQGLPLTLDPRLLYRGIGPSLANEMGQLGLQCAATGALKKALPSTTVGEFSAALGAGALVALFASPCELLMIQQQRQGTSMLETPLKILRTHGVGTLLGRGLGMCAARDAIYVGGMLGFTPICYDWLLKAQSPSSATDDGRPAVSAGAEALASMGSSMIGGTICAVISHPFDVVKTCMQGDLERKTYAGSMQTALALVSEGGRASLMRGVFWRSVNIVASVYIANVCCRLLPPYVKTLTRGSPDAEIGGKQS